MKNIFVICIFISGSCFVAEGSQEKELSPMQQAFVDQTKNDLKKIDPTDPNAIAAALAQGEEDLKTLGATPKQVADLKIAKKAFIKAAKLVPNKSD